MLYIYMTTSNNIVLNVGNSGLSYAIDKELDKQLGMDVTLGFKEWTSVFELIKQEQVASNKSQFTEKDKDVRKGNQFVVQAGENYAITGNVWSQILNIAKQKMGITADENPKLETQAESSAKETENPDLMSEEKSEDKLKTLLNSVGIQIENEDEALQKDVLAKYNTMISVAEANGQEISDKEIQTRLSNYIKGWKYTNFEKNVIENSDLEASFDEHCKGGFESLDEMKTAYREFGDAIVEYYDCDGLNDSQNQDKNVNLHEMFYTTLIDFYTGNGMSKSEATPKAREAVQKYQHLDLAQIDSWNLDDSEEAELLAGVALKIATLDQDGDYRISTDEAGAYMLTMAQSRDDKNAITGQEVFSTASAVENGQDKLFNNLSTYYDFLK